MYRTLGSPTRGERLAYVLQSVLTPLLPLGVELHPSGDGLQVKFSDDGVELISLGESLDLHKATREDLSGVMLLAVSNVQDAIAMHRKIPWPGTVSMPNAMLGWSGDELNIRFTNHDGQITHECRPILWNEIAAE